MLQVQKWFYNGHPVWSPVREPRPAQLNALRFELDTRTFGALTRENLQGKRGAEVHVGHLLQIACRVS